MTLKHTLIAVSVAASFICAQDTFAQDASNQTAQTPERITVLGSRIVSDIDALPGSVSVIDSNYIEASGALFLTDLLRSIAGINISQSGPNGTLSEVRFRGSESNHILVMIDGVEINDLGQGGIADFAHIQASNIERIELLKGPQSALWGASAVAGVINITTKGASETNDKLQANVELGTQNTKRLGLNLKQNTGDTQLALNISHIATDGFNVSRVPAGSTDETDGYDNTSINAHLSHRINDEHTISFSGRASDYRSEFDGVDFVNTGLPSDAENSTQGQQLSAIINWKFAPTQSKLSHHASFQHSQQDVENFSGQAESGGTKGSKTRLNWISSYGFENGHFINAGLDFVDEQFNQSGPIVFGDPNQQQENQTVSLTSDGRYYISESLNATYSLRFDNSDEFDNATSYRLGLNNDISDALRVYIATGKAVKNPTFTERFGFFPQTFIGNPELKPESSVNHELGFVYQVNAYSFDISYFNTTLEDEINGFVFVPEQGSFSAANGELESKREGIELSAKGQFKDLNWQASYAYLDAKDPNERELRRAQHSGSFTLNYAVNENQNAFVQADYTGTRLDRFFPPFPQASQIVNLKAYWLVSANYQVKINENHTVSLRASNLFDESYEDVFGFVGQGRQVSINLSVKL